jgi:hypothetical protein
MSAEARLEFAADQLLLAAKFALHNQMSPRSRTSIYLAQAIGIFEKAKEDLSLERRNWGPAPSRLEQLQMERLRKEADNDGR